MPLKMSAHVSFARSEGVEICLLFKRCTLFMLGDLKLSSLHFESCFLLVAVPLLVFSWLTVTISSIFQSKEAPKEG